MLFVFISIVIKLKKCKKKIGFTKKEKGLVRGPLLLGELTQFLLRLPGNPQGPRTHSAFSPPGSPDVSFPEA